MTQSTTLNAHQRFARSLRALMLPAGSSKTRRQLEEEIVESDLDILFRELFEMESDTSDEDEDDPDDLF